MGVSYGDDLGAGRIQAEEVRAMFLEPLTALIDRGGLVGEDGPTHHGLFDLAYLRSLPNMVVMAPADENECRQMLYTGFQLDQPAAVCPDPAGDDVGDAVGAPVGQVDGDDVAVDVQAVDAAPFEQTPGQLVARCVTDGIGRGGEASMAHAGDLAQTASRSRPASSARRSSSRRRYGRRPRRGPARRWCP